ncbi:MAG: phosphatidylinositol mannoside acyltransferase [Actinomycetota bacterium]|nr:phosphatidylinositol mannoside acyltransferase [Actinomycetota bacterium]
MAELSLAERVIAAGFSLGWRAGPVLDTGAARTVFDGAADMIWRREGPGVAQLRANLRRVVGPDLSEAGLDALSRRALRSYARYFREVFWLPSARPGVIAGRTQVTNPSIVHDVLARGRGVVCALAHTGNWDAAAVAYLDRYGPPMSVVAERLRPESLYQRFQAYRESLGMVVVPLTGGGRSSTEMLATTLRAGGSVCLPCERDLSDNGVPVTFFGKTITVPPGPALLALRTGAALLPASPGFHGDDWTIRFYSEVIVDGPEAPNRLRDKVIQAMQKVVDQLAIGIAEAPEDWHMMQRLWHEDRTTAPARLLSR